MKYIYIVCALGLIIIDVFNINLNVLIMSYREYASRIELLKELIKKERTGTSYELANKLNVSRRTVFDDLAQLRDEGHKIAYSWKKRTYYFLENNFIYNEY